MSWYSRCQVCYGFLESAEGICDYCNEYTAKYLYNPIIKFPDGFSRYIDKQRELFWRVKLIEDGEEKEEENIVRSKLRLPELVNLLYLHH